jgi:Helix-turn-helix domain
MSAPPAKLGTPVHSGPRRWVQTERAAHEQWAALTMRSPRAAALMHRFVALMGHQNAVVISQKTLAKLMGCTDRTIRNALADLVRERWVQVVQLGASATVNAYVVNSNVAWGESRDQRGRLAVFSATVVGDLEDQPANALDPPALRRVPVIFPPEQSLPVGDGEPGAQIALPGMEPVVEGMA